MTPDRRLFATLCAATLAFGAPESAFAQRSSGPVRIEVTSTRINAFDPRESERRRFGRLEFRGGLVLQSTDKRFGGFSGLLLDASGHELLALSDRGHWLQARLNAEGDRPLSLSEATMAPVLGPDGRPLADRGWHDTEALAQDGNTLFVAIERVHRILRFNFGREGLAARGLPVAAPAAIRGLGRNAGIEALAYVPAGLPLADTLLAIAEQAPDVSDTIPGFLIGGPSPGGFHVRRHDEFDITDAAITADGNLILLERHFSLLRGALMRLRRIPLADIRPGATIDGERLIEANLAHEIDNMEALAVHRNAAGETILTIMSDDNFNPLQRTLLLRFALVSGG